MDLNEVKNENCQKCRSKERKTNEFGICTATTSLLDSQPVRCIGDWGRDKIYYLTNYFGIFAKGMKNKFQEKLNYIEICSGPGRCICRETGEEIDGTPLAIINHESFQYLSKAFFVDYSTAVIDTLNKRILQKNVSKNVGAFVGDYTDASSLDIVLNQLPSNGLNLVLIDPTDCSVPFETVKHIANRLGRVDFIINVAIYTDVGRNIRNLISRGYNQDKYHRFLGSNFFDRDDIIELVNQGKDAEVRINFRKAYMDSLRKICYNYFDLKTIGSYYDILFATKNARGIEFWRKATKRDPSNQSELDLT